MNRMENRRGQMDLGRLFTGFVVVASILFLIVLLIYIFGVLALGLESTKDTYRVTNDTNGFINDTGYTLADGIGGVPRDFVITNAWNGTDGSTQAISSGNWSLDGTTGIVTNTTVASWGTVNFNYTYANDSAEIDAAKDAQTNTSRSLPLVGILFVILAVGAVIAILLASMFMGRRRS